VTLTKNNCKKDKSPLSKKVVTLDTLKTLRSKVTTLLDGGDFRFIKESKNG